MRITKAFIVLFVVGFIIAGCSPSTKGSSQGAEGSTDEKLSIYTTIYPLQFAAERIGGETVNVETVYPPGGDAHTYEPTSKDMTAIAESDAFIYLGAGMEAFAESAADALASQDVKLIEIGKHEELFHDYKEAHDHEGEEAYEHEGEEAENHESIKIEGLSDHYHSDDAVQLTAVLSEETTHEHWHWYTLEPNETEWETVPDQGTNHYEGQADTSGQQIKATLFDDDHNIIAESEAVEIIVEDHGEEEHAEHEADDHGEHSHDGHNHGDQDPHIWLDPIRMIEVAEIVKEELIELNPDEEATYNENFKSLEAELTALDERFSEVLEAKENKHILVAHAAFGYWEERYGIKQIAISGLSSSSEPSQKELVEVIDLAEEYNLDYILYEQNTTNRVSDIIQEQIGAEALTIHNLSVLTDEDIDNHEDYLSLMDYNLEVLDKATK
ncbi:metal ABC transporter solute-binding protein, Zn/Mn family [Oceanobacillus massiliensis]|uniref:metal ABC transporter solute-binding protein, Zn/Mn family n=1 Tax=Oceanobacillus massiliensis TaxID=1465765 RepID=UPI00301B5758